MHTPHVKYDIFYKLIKIINMPQMKISHKTSIQKDRFRNTKVSKCDSPNLLNN